MACSCSPINWRERVAQVLLAVAVGVISTLFPCDRMAVLGEFNVCVNKFADVYRPPQPLEMVPASPRSAASMSAQTRPRLSYCIRYHAHV